MLSGGSNKMAVGGVSPTTAAQQQFPTGSTAYAA